MESTTTTTSDIMNPAIRVVLIGSERVTRAGLRMFIDSHPGLQVVGEFESPGDPGAWSSGQPQIAVIDLDCASSVTLIPDGRSHVASTRIIVLTSSPDSEACSQAIQRGVLGVVSKQQAPEVLIKAIERVHAGEAWVNRAKIAGVLGDLRASAAAKTAAAVGKPETLMPRERQIITLVGQGFRNGEIAASILVSEATVRNCLGSIFKKVGVTNRVQLMLFAIREGFVSLPAAGDSPISPREVLRLATSAGRLLGNKRTRESAT